MIEKPSFSDQDIIDCLKTDYGIKVTDLTLLRRGADINAAVYKALSNDQSTYFIKLKRGHHYEQSLTIAKHLHETGIHQIIPPIETTQGQSSQIINDFTVIVYPYVEGKDGFSQSLTHDQWVTFGKTMRQVHEINLPLSIQNHIRRETFSAKWRETIRSL
jgi:spectinomycin phosphotransferase